MTERIIQRIVFPTDPPMQSLYCRFVEPRDGLVSQPEFPDRFSVRIWRGSKLSTDTYFNTFFESHWRQFTRIARLRLRLVVAGAGTICLLRRGSLSGQVVLGAKNFVGDPAEIVLDVPSPKLHRRETGLLHFELAARSEQLLLRKAEWTAEVEKPASVKLVVGCCTFNREESLLHNVETLLGDPAVGAVVEHVVVIDQGSRPIRKHPAFSGLAARVKEKFHLVEQDNFGGAGGFTRCILEARAVAGATHVLLMDDDIIVEPESVFRAAAFLAVARPDHAVGSPMLDMLRPLEVFEAGGCLDLSRLCGDTPVSRRRVDTPESLMPLGEPTYTDYNAWWFFAFPLPLIERLGLPLPLFIRGDDAEFGYRLLQAGVSTVTLPGLGVWHQPPYLKKDGWHSYYDLRNMLVMAAVHHPSRQQAARFLFLKLWKRLLLLDYLQATLLCEAVDDFCRGPALLDAHPRTVHQKVMALQQEHTPELIPRARRLPAAPPTAPPSSKAGQALHLLRCILRQFLLGSPGSDAKPCSVYQEAKACWSVLGMADVVAVDGWRPDHYDVLRRSRKRFLRLLGRGLWSACRLCWRYRKVVQDWRNAFPRLTSLDFWRGYLEAAPAVPEDAGRETASRRAA